MLLRESIYTKHGAHSTHIMHANVAKSTLVHSMNQEAPTVHTHIRICERTLSIESALKGFFHTLTT